MIQAGLIKVPGSDPSDKGKNMLAVQKEEIPGLEDFLALSHRRSFNKRSTVISAGAESRSIYYLTKGSVTVSIEDEEGNEMIIAYLNEGSFFGEMGLFNEGARSALKLKRTAKLLRSVTAVFRN